MERPVAHINYWLKGNDWSLIRNFIQHSWKITSYIFAIFTKRLPWEPRRPRGILSMLALEIVVIKSALVEQPWRKLCRRSWHWFATFFVTSMLQCVLREFCWRLWNNGLVWNPSFFFIDLFRFTVWSFSTMSSCWSQLDIEQGESQRSQGPHLWP